MGVTIATFSTNFALSYNDFSQAQLHWAPSNWDQTLAETWSSLLTAPLEQATSILYSAYFFPFMFFSLGFFPVTQVWILSPHFFSAFLSYTELVPLTSSPMTLSSSRLPYLRPCNCFPTGFYLESLFSLINTSCCCLLRKIPFSYSCHQKLQ